MAPAIQFTLLLLLSFSISDAKIEFSYSTVYDLYDFEGIVEVPLPRCNSGCLIFASAFGIYESNMEPYIKNLVISDSSSGKLATVGELVNKFHPDTTQKLPLDLPAKGNYSILNLNPQETNMDDVIFDTTLWIVERSKAQQIDYEIYDVKTMHRAPAVPNSVITIMGSIDIELYAQQSWEVNSYSIRFAGFDNAFDDNEDLCEPVMQSTIGSIFDGFKFEVQTPLLSIVFANKTTIDLNAKDGDSRYRALSSPGVITSPGYIGCRRLGVDQVYRNTFYHKTERVVLNGDLKDYQVVIDCVSDLDGDSLVELTDVNKGLKNRIAGLGGQMHYQLTIPSTQMLFVDYNNITVPRSFILKYTATRTNRLDSPLNTTSTAIASTSQATTTTPSASEDLKGPAIIVSDQLTTTSATAALPTLAGLVVVCVMLQAI